MHVSQVGYNNDSVTAQFRIGQELPYSGKFSKGPIFAVFAIDWQTTKMKPAK